MVHQSSTSASSSPYTFFLFLLIFLTHGAITTLAQVTNIGAIIDVNSRVGREEKIAMEIAVNEYNNISGNKYKLFLHVTDSGGDPLAASKAAEKLIKESKVQAIVGMETWQETILVVETAKQAQVPVISFAPPAFTPPLTSVRWPFLLRMASNDSLQMECLASIISSYGWRKVIVIYEDDFYSTDSSVLSLFSEVLQRVGSQIEQWSVFPPFSTLSDPETIIREELEKLINKQSRVFIIVRSSVQLVTRLFPLAKELGLMGRDSVWITTDAITSLFDSFNSLIMQSMKGVIGIKAHFSQTSPIFKKFSNEFRNTFHSTYLDEEKFEPGMHALRAYDTISIITKGIPQYVSLNISLLQNFLASNFNGLSGEVRFNNRELYSPSIFQIVNVNGTSYGDLKFWSPESRFYDDEKTSRRKSDVEPKKLFEGRVCWPGGEEAVPKGWVMPTNAKQWKIGVPGNTSFEKFVKINEKREPEGFSIEIFKAAVGRLGYDLPHEFEPFYGTYDELVDKVYHKEYDAVVGDITILANRSHYVDFTQPYAESRLSMVVSVKPGDKGWLFLKPFTMAMWFVTGAVFFYTMFVVWFLERRSNPDFGGPWKDQMSTTLWFTFSTLFFAHRERLESNYTRVTLVIWLFVVFVVTSSYTASLTSILTVQRIEPTVTDIQTLVRSGAVVGCDGDSFVRKYLEGVLGFKPENIKNITSEYDYPDALSSGMIKAAFLERPYEKVFLSRYCKEYKDTRPNYRFGGLAFVFQKGSPVAADFSRAFLELSEKGTITDLEKHWFSPTPRCSNSDNNMENGSLSLSNFWGLLLVTGITSTMMLILYLCRLIAKFRRQSASSSGDLREQLRRFVSYLVKNQVYIPPKTPILVQPSNGTTGEWMPSNTEHVSLYPDASPTVEIEMPEAIISRSAIQTRVLTLASFPGRGRRDHGFDIDDPEWHRLPSSSEF